MLMEYKFNKLRINNVKKQNFFDNNLQHIYYFDYLRIFSSILIILIHISAFYYIKIQLIINSYIWKISYYYNSISRCGVPIFFMISGAVFLNRDITFKKLFVKYIKGIFIHLLIWSVFHSVIYNIENHETKIKSIIYQIIKSHYHLWYLFALLGIYMIIPFLREISKNKQILETFIFLSFIILLIIPRFIHILSLRYQIIYGLFTELYNKMNFKYFSIYHFYFVYGHYLNVKKIDNRNNRILIYVLGLIGIIFTTKISYNISIIKEKKLDYFGGQYLNIFFYSTSVFVYFKYNLEHSKFNKKKCNYFRKISNYTFGIYLIHPFIIEKIIEKYHINELKINILLLIPMNALIVFILSLIISIILKYIPFIGKYIV